MAEPAAAQAISAEDVAHEAQEALKPDAPADAAVHALLKVAGLSAKADVLRFYELGGVHSFCALLRARQLDTAHSEFLIAAVFAAHAMLSVGQLRSLMVIKGAMPPLAAACGQLLDFSAIEGSSAGELTRVKLEAASCLNVLPMPHELFTEAGLPEAVMRLLCDETYPALEADEEQLRSFAATNLLDAGLMLATNFSCSEAFFDRLMALGLCEVVVRVAQRWCGEEKALRDGAAHTATVVRFVTLLSVLFCVEHSRAKLEFLDEAADESRSLVKTLLPELAMHENMAVRSLAHQVLAEYAGVTESKHEWVVESIPPEQPNEIEPAFGVTRLCANTLCGKEEKEPLDFKWCAKCRIPVYCCPECQKIDWAQHKHLCKKMR